MGKLAIVAAVGFLVVMAGGAWTWSELQAQRVEMVTLRRQVKVHQALQQPTATVLPQPTPTRVAVPDPWEQDRRLSDLERNLLLQKGRIDIQQRQIEYIRKTWPAKDWRDRMQWNQEFP